MWESLIEGLGLSPERGEQPRAEAVHQIQAALRGSRARRMLTIQQHLASQRRQGLAAADIQSALRACIAPVVDPLEQPRQHAVAVSRPSPAPTQNRKSMQVTNGKSTTAPQPFGRHSAMRAKRRTSTQMPAPAERPASQRPATASSLSHKRRGENRRSDTVEVLAGALLASRSSSKRSAATTDDTAGHRTKQAQVDRRRAQQRGRPRSESTDRLSVSSPAGGSALSSQLKALRENNSLIETHEEYLQQAVRSRASSSVSPGIGGLPDVRSSHNTVEAADGSQSGAINEIKGAVGSAAVDQPDVTKPAVDQTDVKEHVGEASLDTSQQAPEGSAIASGPNPQKYHESECAASGAHAATVADELVEALFSNNSSTAPAEKEAEETAEEAAEEEAEEAAEEAAEEEAETRMRAFSFLSCSKVEWEAEGKATVEREAEGKATVEREVEGNPEVSSTSCKPAPVVSRLDLSRRFAMGDAVSQQQGTRQPVNSSPAAAAGILKAVVTPAGFLTSRNPNGLFASTPRFGASPEVQMTPRRQQVIAERNKLAGRMETVKHQRIELDSHSSAASAQSRKESENTVRELRLQASDLRRLQRNSEKQLSCQVAISGELQRQLDNSAEELTQLQLLMNKREVETPRISPSAKRNADNDDGGSASDEEGWKDAEIERLKTELLTAQTNSLEHKMGWAQAEERRHTAEERAVEWERMLEATQDELDELHDVVRLQEELESEAEALSVRQEGELHRLKAQVRELEANANARRVNNGIELLNGS